jgi:predicted HTH domain antitoxin
VVPPLRSVSEVTLPFQIEPAQTFFDLSMIMYTIDPNCTSGEIATNEANTTMQVLSIPYSDDLLVSTGKSKEALEQELRFLLAVKPFELRRLSLGKAAQLCSMSKLTFMDELGRMGIPVINLDDDQIQDELNNA